MRDKIEQMLEDPNRSPVSHSILEDIAHYLDEGFSFEEAKVFILRGIDPMRKPLAIFLFRELHQSFLNSEWIE